MTPWAYPRIFAHRGGGSLAPENTLAAIRLGQSLGYRAHEFDVKLSKDGIAFLMHDPTLERTTSGRGASCERTWAELCTFDAGAWHSEGFRGERLPSLEEAARLLRSRGTLANIEIKPSPGFERVTGEVVAREAASLWHEESVPPLLSSFTFDALVAAREAVPELPRGWLTKEIVPEDWERLERLEAVSVHTDFRTLDRANIAKAHDRGLRVLLYTVNDPDLAEELLAAGVDGLFTDNLDVFARRFAASI